MSIKIGQKISEFSLPMTGDQVFNPRDYEGKKIILYFYPKDNTPGCRQESQDFTQAYETLIAANTVVFGVSRDSISSHEKFKAKYDMPFELISDPDEKLCQYFDVIKEKSMFGKHYMGLERSTFVLDEQGVLVGQWRKVKVKDHVNQVLEFIQSK